MIDTSIGTGVTSVQEQIHRTWWAKAFLGLGLLGLIGIVGLISFRRGSDASIIAWLLFYGVIATIFYNPRYGIYLILGLTLVQDGSLIYWYPFVKGFSSFESIFYLHGSLIFSPLELCVVLTFVSWMGRPILLRQKIDFTMGLLFWPVLIFISFITLGLVYGVLQRGNVNFAFWEIRSIYFMPVMLILVSNLIKTREQVIILIWVAAVALFIKAIVGSLYVANELQFAIGSVDRIAEHAMSIQLATVIVLTVAAFFFRARPSRKIILPLMLPFVMISFMANNRRASFIALGIALALLLIILFLENRRLFWLVAPPAIILGTAYLAVFWTSESPLAMPANAVRSVFGEPTERDASSNLYREMENLNTMFTITTAPLTGVGFGNKFLIIAPMADISFFVFWEYITHNSILWIWMKAGLGAFLSMMFMFGWSLMLGARTIRLMPNGELRTIAIVATLYILMHCVFAYVDMSWDAVSMVYMGTMMALINVLPTIAAQPVPVPTRRWPWQPVRVIE